MGLEKGLGLKLVGAGLKLSYGKGIEAFQLLLTGVGIRGFGLIMFIII
jgi:hypothetical protein